MRTNRFLTSALPWIQLGFNVIPARLDDLKRPARTFKEWYPPDAPRIPQNLYETWFEQFNDANALVLWSSRPNGCIVVVDADEADRFAWVEETFGENPYCVETGRLEGGRHYLYRVPNPVRGRNGLVHGIDVKCWGGYTVAPGAIHKESFEGDFPRLVTYNQSWTGRLSWEELPEFPINTYEQLRGTRNKSTARKATVDLTAEPPTPVDPKLLERFPLEERLALAKKKLEALPSAIQGQAGDSQTFRAALVGGDYGLSADEFWPLLTQYNLQCRPPWDEAGLRAKLASAQKYRQKSFGSRLEQIVQETSFSKALLGKFSNPPKKTLSWRRNYEHIEEVELEEGRADGARNPCQVDEMIFDVRGTGVGKTQSVIDEVGDSAVLAVSPLVSLCRDLASRLRATLYQDLTLDSMGSVEKLVATLQGFHKQPYCLREHLLLDEIGMQFEFLLSQTSGKRLVENAPAVLSSLFDVIAATPKVHLNEACLDPRIVEFVIRETQKRNPKKKFRIVGDEHLGNPIAQVSNSTAKMLAWMHVRDQKQGSLTWIGSSRTDLLIEFDGLIQKERPDLRVLVLTGGKEGTVNDPDIQELLRHPNQMTKDYDVVLASPVVASGVSITEEVDRVFFLHKYANVHARTIVQSCARCRNVKFPVTVVGVDNWGEKDVVLDFETIEQDICRRAQKDDALYPLVRQLIDGALTLIDKPFLELGVLVELQRRENQANRLAELEKHFALHGRPLKSNLLPAGEFAESVLDLSEETFETIQAVMRAGFAEGKRTHDEKTRDGIFAAKDISDSYAAQLRIAYSKTEEQQYQIVRNELTNFYGKEAGDYVAREISPELIEKDGYGVRSREGGLLRPGRLRRQAWRYVDVETIGSEGFRAMLEVCFKENTRSDGKLCQPPERTSRARRARFLYELVMVGLQCEIGVNPNVWLTCGDVERRVEQFLRERSEDFGDFLRGDQHLDAYGWFEDQLRGLGCKICKEGKKGDERRDKKVHFDWGEIQEGAVRERERRRKIDEVKEVAA